MAELEKQSSSELTTADAEAIRHLEREIMGGKHWYIALLEAIGLWRSSEEVHNNRTYRYLVAGEAFDWLLLAERLCEAVNGLLPVKEKEALLFYGKPPLNLTSEKVKELIGINKYNQYLNYFYGITVEQALVLAVQEEVHKERQLLHHCYENDTIDEAHRRIYGATRAELLRRFRRERGRRQLHSISLDELKEFTYWLFKHRLKECEPARVASDTKKALDYLRRQWAMKGFSGALVSDKVLTEGVRLSSAEG